MTTCKLSLQSWERYTLNWTSPCCKFFTHSEFVYKNPDRIIIIFFSVFWMLTSHVLLLPFPSRVKAVPISMPFPHPPVKSSIQMRPLPRLSVAHLPMAYTSLEHQDSLQMAPTPPSQLQAAAQPHCLPPLLVLSKPKCFKGVLQRVKGNT